MAHKAPVVNLHVTLVDKSKSTAVAGSASLDTCVWELGKQVGMYGLSTSTASNSGYIFRSPTGKWRSNEHPTLTLADAGVKQTGDMVQFMGDFDVYTPPPVVPGAVVELQVMRMEKGTSTTVTGKATLDKCVWQLGYDLGLQAAAPGSPATPGGSVFIFGSKHWNSNQHPNLTLAEAGVRRTGEMVVFFGDFAPGSPATTRVPSAPATPPMVPASPPMAPASPPMGAGSVDLKVTVDALSKSITKMCRTNLDKCVWAFGEDIGLALLSHPSSTGYVFSYAGHNWRSNEHPELTLAEAGVQNGGSVIFTADFQALASQKAGPSVEITVTLLDKSRSWTATAKAALEKNVWSFGEEVGMRRLTTGPLSNYGYVVRCDGREWRSNRHPNLTLADAGVTESAAAIEFLGDFEPPARRASAELVGLHVLLGKEMEPSSCKTSLDKGVWRFGEEVGAQKLLTSSLSHFGYVFHFGEQTWRKAHHPDLTLAEAGVKDGDTVHFTGDFEPI